MSLVNEISTNEQIDEKVEIRFETGHRMLTAVPNEIMKLIGSNLKEVTVLFQSWSQKERRWFKNLYVPNDVKVEDEIIRVNEERNRKKPVIGIHTWAEHCDDINQEKIMPMVEKFIEVKNAFEKSTGRGPDDNQYVFIIDDGAVNLDIGNPIREDRFPDISEIVGKLEKEDITPAMWLAPFWVKPNSRIRKENPEWLVRNKDGTFVEKGFLDNGLFTKEKQLILDISNPEAKKYMLDKINGLYDMGFRYLKMDYLYLLWDDPKRNIKEIDSDFISFMQEIKATHPDIRILGCGCPLHVSEYVDDLRVGGDSVFIQYERFIKSLGEFINNFNFDGMLNACIEKLVLPNVNFDLDVLLKSSHGISPEQTEKWHSILKTLMNLGRGNIVFGDNILNMDTDEIVQTLASLSGERQIIVNEEP